MLSDEEKNNMELDIEAKYVGKTEKEFLNNVTYAECLYILDTKNKYCDDIRDLSLLKIVEIIEKQSKEIEELKVNNKKLQNKCKELIFEKQGLTSALLDSTPNDKIKAKIEIRKEEKENCKDSIEEKYLLREIYVLQSLLEKED